MRKQLATGDDDARPCIHPAPDWGPAVVALEAGAVVAIPTDTVYGLAADPARPGATAALFELKGRPGTLEVPVLVDGVGQADALAGPDGLPPVARVLAAAFWPGALTIVVERRPGFDVELGGNPRTVGLRCPAHDGALALCRAVGPLATTSANTHGNPPCTSAAEVASVFGGAVGVVVDGGRCDGLPSTVVDVTGVGLRCLRRGAVPWGEVERAIGDR